MRFLEHTRDDQQHLELKFNLQKKQYQLDETLMDVFKLELFNLDLINWYTDRFGKHCLVETRNKHFYPLKQQTGSNSLEEIGNFVAREWGINLQQ